MSDITQADRDAANEAQRYAIMRVGSMHEAFANHREQAAAEECAKIVAWLMREEDGYPSTDYSGFAAMIREMIEAKEHLK